MMFLQAWGRVLSRSSVVQSLQSLSILKHMTNAPASLSRISECSVHQTSKFQHSSSRSRYSSQSHTSQRHLKLSSQDASVSPPARSYSSNATASPPDFLDQFTKELRQHEKQVSNSVRLLEDIHQVEGGIKLRAALLSYETLLESLYPTHNPEDRAVKEKKEKSIYDLAVESYEPVDVWNSTILALHLTGNGELAWKAYECMKRAGVEANMKTLKYLIRIVSAPIKRVRLHMHNAEYDPPPQEGDNLEFVEKYLEQVDRDTFGEDFEDGEDDDEAAEDLAAQREREKKGIGMDNDGKGDFWPEWPRVFYCKSAGKMTLFP